MSVHQWFVCLTFLLLSFTTAQAQNFPLLELDVITIENAEQIVEVARLGSGVVRRAALSPDGSLLAVAATLGVWLHDLDNPEAAPRLLEGQGGAVAPGMELARDDLLLPPKLDRLLDAELEVVLAALEPEPTEVLGTVPRIGDLTDHELEQLLEEVEGS